MKVNQKKVYLIRHAESEANVGDSLFRHSDIIKITENGKRQAQDLVEVLGKDLPLPDKIIVSKFIRTQETSEPFIKKLIDSNHIHGVHLWLDVHEFDTVCGARIDDIKSRQDFVDANNLFWTKSDPFYKDSEHLETFAEFINRVNSVILKLKKLNNVNYVFTHGWFIKMFLLLCNEYTNFNEIKNKENIYSEIMIRFVEWGKEFKTKNTGVYEVTELLEKYGE